MDRRETALLKKIKLDTGQRMNTLLMGEYHSAFRGTGISFHSVREYSYGDDSRTIDWKVSARMNNLFVKEYIEERELSVVLLIDGSASTLFGSSKTKRETIIETASLFLYLCQMNNDRVSAMIFTDRVEKQIQPKKGRKFILQALNGIREFKPEGRGTDLPCVIDFAMKTLKKRSIVIIISDFLDPGSGLEGSMRRLGRKHDVIPVEVRDPLENSVAFSGLIEYEELETGKTALAECSSTEGIAAPDYPFEPLKINTGKPVVEALLDFFRKRNRQPRRQRA